MGSSKGWAHREAATPPRTATPGHRAARPLPHSVSAESRVTSAEPRRREQSRPAPRPFLSYFIDHSFSSAPADATPNSELAADLILIKFLFYYAVRWHHASVEKSDMPCMSCSLAEPCHAACQAATACIRSS